MTGTAIVLAARGELVGFAKVLASVNNMERLGNGVYKALSKDQKAAVKKARLETALGASTRLISGELVAKGYKAELAQMSTLKDGSVRFQIEAYKRPEKVEKVKGAVDLSTLTAEQLEAELAKRKAGAN